MANRTCSIDGCDREVHARDMCMRHYQQWRYHNRDKIHRTPPTLYGRWLRFVDKDSPGGCWEWTGSKASGGYGRYTYDSGDGTGKRPHPAHRVGWKILVGPLDDALDLDHLCHNHACVNPAHLRPCTRGQNLENRKGGHGTSGRRGVMRKGNRWMAYCAKNGNRYIAGYFDDLDEAAEAARLLRLKVMTHNHLDRLPKE